QPDAPGLGGVNHLPGEEQFEGPAPANQPGESHGPAVARADPELHLRLAETGGVARDPDVAGHRQLAATSEAEAVDRRNDRLAERLEAPEDRLSRQRPRLALEGRL